MSHLHESCHAHTTFGPYMHSDTLKTQLCSSSAIIIPHISCNSLTHILHLKYNSLSILLCFDSDLALIHYVISLHFITLTSSLLPTSHPVTSRNTLVTLLTKLPASSGSRCHFPSHSEIPRTYVSRSNLDALPVTPSTVISPLLPDLPDHGRYLAPTLSLILV